MNQREVGLLLMMLIPVFPTGNAAIAGQPTTVQLTPAQHEFSADIAGHKVRLWFDLGAEASLTLSRATLNELGIEPTGPGHSFMDVKGRKLESRTFAVPRLTIGSAVFINVPGIVDFHTPPLGQGYIGPSLFAAYRIVLNHRDGTMTLIPPETQDIERAGCIGTAVQSPDGVSKVQTDFGDLILVWDTGAGVSFVRKPRIDQAHAEAVNQAVLTEHFRLNGVDFGPLGFRVFQFSEPPGVDGFIGMNFFAKHVVCLDFPGKRIVIQR